MGFIRKEGNNKLRLIRNNIILQQIIEENKIIDINEDNGNEMILGGGKEIEKEKLLNILDKKNKETKKIDKLQKILDKINKEKYKYKDIFVTYDDIIDKDNYNNFIAVKSNDKAWTDIKTLNKDNFINNNLDSNNLKNNFFLDFNKIFTNENNPMVYKENNLNKHIKNINNKSSILIQCQKPIDLHFISRHKHNIVFEKNNSTFIKEENVNDTNETNFTYAEAGEGETYTMLEKQSNTCLQILMILFVLIITLMIS